MSFNPSGGIICAGGGASGGGNRAHDDVVDAEFEEIDETKKKKS